MSYLIGHGYDIHRLHAGGVLMLGGVCVAEGLSAVAHSDGDVVIHALVDAMLGAAGLGDIGQHFPDKDERYRGASSELFIKETMKKLSANGLIVVNGDVTIMAERPRLESVKSTMREVLSNLLGAPVNIKAGTNEGCGEIGKGDAIAAHAVVLLGRV